MKSARALDGYLEAAAADAAYALDLSRSSVCPDDVLAATEKTLFAAAQRLHRHRRDLNKPARRDSMPR